MEFVDVIGILGFILTMFVVASPIPSLLKGIEKGELNSISFEYLVLAAAQGVLWFLFGYKETDFYVKLTNFFVVLVYLVYFNTFLYINKDINKAMYSNSAFFVYFGFCAYFMPGKFCLTAAAIACTLWQFTTISKIREALSTKDPSFINITIAYASFVVFNFWAIYSLLTSNYIMFIPNSLGGVIFSFNLIIYYWATGSLSDSNYTISLLKKLFFAESTQKTPNPLLDLNTSRSSYNKL